MSSSGSQTGSNEGRRPRPHSGNLRQYRRREGHGCWFVTKCLCPRGVSLSPEHRSIVADALLHYHRVGQLRLAAFVVMPDHWHALVGTREGQPIAEFMQKACRWIGRQTLDGLRSQGCAWQDGFYETLVKSGKQFTYIRHYIEENPVRKGFVPAAREWQWSSSGMANGEDLMQTWEGVLPEL